MLHGSTLTLFSYVYFDQLQEYIVGRTVELSRRASGWLQWFVLRFSFWSVQAIDCNY